MSVLFPASVVGSLPRPAWVRDLLECRDQINPEEFQRRIDSAIGFAIGMQEAAGLDVISDGEWRRWSYIGVIADLCQGFERTFVEGRSWHSVTEPITAGQTGCIAAEARFLKAHTDKLIKVCLPSPYLLGVRMWDKEHSRKAYPTRRQFMEALIPFLRNELLLVRDAGANIVQIDDPHLCLFVDESVRDQFKDWKSEAELCVDLINQVVSGITGIKLGVHLCRRNKGRDGWVGEGGYGPILPFLKKINVHQLVMEFTIPVAGDFSALEGLPDDKEIGLGCVDVRNAEIDPPQHIVERVERALKYVEPGRLTLNPDCGFAPGNAADIPFDEAYRKLCCESQAAAILRSSHG